MKCWHCGGELEDPPRGQLPFRAVCDHCSSWLHCCKNCKYYAPGMPNDCKVPGTEQISDREASNFCEEYVIKGSGPESIGDPSEAARRLFGEDPNSNEDNDKDPFSSLFKGS